MQTKLGSNIDNFEVRQPKRFEIWLTHFFGNCLHKSLEILINDIDAKKNKKIIKSENSQKLFIFPFSSTTFASKVWKILRRLDDFFGSVQKA